MKKLIVFVFMLVSFIKAQTIDKSFVLKENKHADKEVFYISSILKSNLEQFRLRDKRVSLVFKNGFILELLSAKELVIAHKLESPNAYEAEFPKDFLLPKMEILPGGMLTAEVPMSPKLKTSIKNN